MDTSASPDTAEAGAQLTIDLGTLAENWRRLAVEAAGAECAAVIKADAYGCGIDETVPALARAGCRTFFVAHPVEGRRARAACPQAEVYILNGLMPGAAEGFVRDRLTPVLGSPEEIADWAATGHPFALHVDTGMNRLGLSLAQACEAAAGVTPRLVMSHLVSAEVPGDPLTIRQIADFRTIAALFPGVPASLANSSGTFLGARARFDLVRPGYALYGGNPTPGRTNPMRPVVRLDGRIIQVREVRAHETAGYNARWTAPEPRRLATISVGYADGYGRAASATDGKGIAGEAVVGGVRCPFAGVVSMDLIILDVTRAPPDAVARGAPVTLVGDGLDVDEVGRRAGTIGYEVLTRLGRRYARAYVD